jgi:pimeloyl-ACP methyl ester carboxylesterase
MDGLAAFYAPPPALSPAPPGSLLRSEVMDTAGSLPSGATAYRVVYDSTSLSGNLVAVSGVIVVPGGAPPPGGFPIVSWAHGTTGLAASCAPSLSGLSGIPSLTALLEARMIVVATDYPGLGVAGPDPYLVGQSEAQSVLDIARAARNLEGQAASNRVLVVGYSQGGQAALFAGQIAPSYAPELYLEGVAAVAPVASITELAPVAPGDRADPDAGFALMALRAWSDTYGNIPLGSVLTDQAIRQTGVMTTACSGAVDAAYDGTPTDRLFRAGWSANPALHAADVANQPGHAPTAAPLLVVQGTADNLVPYASTTRLVTDSLCGQQNDVVRLVVVPGAGHQGALQLGQPVILQWMAERLAGQVPTDTCPRSPEPTLG